MFRLLAFSFDAVVSLCSIAPLQIDRPPQANPPADVVIRFTVIETDFSFRTTPDSRFKMPFAFGGTTKQDVAVARAEAPHLAKVTWYKEPGMRKLYFYAAILCVCSATTGYDGYVVWREESQTDRDRS